MLLRFPPKTLIQRNKVLLVYVSEKELFDMLLPNNFCKSCLARFHQFLSIHEKYTGTKRCCARNNIVVCSGSVQVHLGMPKYLETPPPPHMPRNAGGSSHTLITRLMTQKWLDPGDDWMEDEQRSSNSSIKYEYRVICDSYYYGSGCANFCRPRDDKFGHYTCDPSGARICLSGWKGAYCDRPTEGSDLGLSVWEVYCHGSSSNCMVGLAVTDERIRMLSTKKKPQKDYQAYSKIPPYRKYADCKKFIILWAQHDITGKSFGLDTRLQQQRWTRMGSFT
ncbi:hypothetical protein RUM43_010645 [Polyplax serrata]|uniref:Delta-like protein n=1 Tax=Polyplax serrata TaxID=468196 RepID=A0AAN8P0P3_POLSC